MSTNFIQIGGAIVAIDSIKTIVKTESYTLDNDLRPVYNTSCAAIQVQFKRETESARSFQIFRFDTEKDRDVAWVRILNRLLN